MCLTESDVLIGEGGFPANRQTLLHDRGGLFAGGHGNLGELVPASTASVTGRSLRAAVDDNEICGRSFLDHDLLANQLHLPEAQ